MFARDGTPDNKLARHAASIHATPRAVRLTIKMHDLVPKLVGTFIFIPLTLYLE